ncbi:MAG: ATP-binding protein [Planctomycetota bacterium]
MSTLDPLELQRRNDQLQAEIDRLRRMAMIGELASTTTHEFNNILMTILNYAQMGQRNQDTAARDKAFDRIMNAAERATKVSSSVLAMSRTRGDDKAPVDLKTLIEDTLVLLEREFRKFRVQLELELNDVPKVDATANEIQRVVVNLLVNARQATEEGGWVRVGLVADGQEVKLTIRDTGTGIQPDVLPRIFDPFFSTKSGPDESGKGGTGIGLSACKDVIDAHSGRIRVESTVGKGTAFIIRLPISAAAGQGQAIAKAG